MIIFAKIILSFFLMLFLFLFLLGMMIRFDHYAYTLSMIGLVIAITAIIHFVAAISWQIAILTMLCLAISPRVFSFFRIAPDLEIYVNSKKDSLKISIVVPLIILHFIKLIPNSVSKKINSKTKIKASEFIKLLLKEGKGLLIDISSKDADVKIKIS